MITLIAFIGLICFLLGYLFYGRYLDRKYDIDDENLTPSHAMYDGIDYVPARPSVLLGHHFSSIAGAGPIVGPIIAGIAFGWLPTLIWIILGCIFFGGVHDFSSLIASVRHKGFSIAEIANQYITKRACLLFLAFIWLALVYVITVFTDLTSATFVADGGVATSSIAYMGLAVCFGFSVYRAKIPFWLSSVIFVSLVFFFLWFGHLYPIDKEYVPAFISNDPAKTWNIVLLVYCFIASVTPVWILLQPRDYLSSFLLYASVISGFIGIMLGGMKMEYPAIVGFTSHLGPLFPILFVTVACGAISGFHSMVASGTSSKQLDKESNTRMIGYGAMLIEGVVAIIALATVMILPFSTELAKIQPIQIYGEGMGRFVSVLGIKSEHGVSFGLLALSTFILTTLDTATRLGRYIFQEVFDMKGKSARFLATFATLVFPAIFVLISFRDTEGNPISAWKIIWPVFGATNQLLAGLTLLVISVWLKKKGKNNLFVVIPMYFMIAMTLWALLLLILKFKISVVGGIAFMLFILAILLVIEAIASLRREKVAIGQM